MLKDLIPSPWRKSIYAAYAVAATIVGALNIGGAHTGKAGDVIAYLGIAVGALAAGNTAGVEKNEDGISDLGLIVGALVFAALLYLIFGR